MENFLQYLENAKNRLQSNKFENIHIVLGNESCDLDSCISALILGYFLHVFKPSKIPAEALIISVQNVLYENFILRTDNSYVLQEAGIPLNLLIYRDQIHLDYLLKEKTVTVTLVDHHILNPNDISLKPFVVQIFDHRPIDPTCAWNESRVNIRIEQVGSCSTIIADEILKKNKDFLFKQLAYLIYETVIYDTIALLPENGKAKCLDLTVAGKLEKQFEFTEGRKNVYEKLWAVHNDVSHLTPKQLLLKDLKIVDHIPVPGLPMLVEDFLALNDSYNAVKNMAKNYKTSIIILIGLDARSDVKRDVAIFFESDAMQLKDIILQKLKNSESLKGYNFLFEDRLTKYDNIVCLRQNNIKLSRKQIIPLITDAVLEMAV